MNTVNFRDIHVVGGQGAVLKTQDGRGLIDFFTDVGTASLGYNPPELLAAMQMLYDGGNAGVIHSPILFTHAYRDLVAEIITTATGMDKVFFANSGVEAVEAAIKLARLHSRRIGQHREAIFTARGGFHGRTLAGLAAGDGPLYHKDGFGPLPECFGHFSEIDQIPVDSCAVMLAPVFGNNDVRLYPDGWLQELRAYTKEHGILLIFDEVQTGSGRCGAMTYAQKVGIQPDIITLGKGVAMGAPVGVMLARGEVADAFTPGTHFSTFGGNPLCCSFMFQMLSWITKGGDRGNLSLVRAKGDWMADMMAKLPHVKAVRHVGMLLAADLDVDTLELARRCEGVGLLLGAFRTGPGPLKITPPLNIDTEELALGFGLLKHVLETWDNPEVA